MSYEDSCESRQNNEFEALQAIYGEDVKDLRTKAAWKKWSPLNIAVTLTPQRGSSGNKDIYVQIDLHFVCSNSYPNSVPKLRLENSKGLSNTVLVNLLEELEKKAEELKGEEMIFQLCQFVEEFLHQHNKPVMKSFYDEMLRQQREKELLDLHQRQLEQDRQRQNVMKEVQQRQEILKSEEKLWRERRNSENSNEDEFGASRRHSTINRKHNDSSTESSEESICSHKGTSIIEFGNREIQRGQCIKHSSTNGITFSGIDIQTGELVSLCEWKFDIKNHEVSQIQRQLSSIEQEINYLTKLRHVNLVHYLGLRYQVVDSLVVVYLLREFICGSNCSSLFVDQNIKIDVDFLKYIAKGVLSALEYLHRNNVVHKNLEDLCVYINDKGVIKVSDYSIQRRLADLLLSSHGYYSKKTDIYELGKLLVSLLSGNSKCDEDVDIPNTLQPDLYDFLSRCLTQDEKERFTAAQLLNHPFFRQPQVHFSPHNDVKEEPPGRTVSPEISRNLLTLSQSQAGSQSRISNEFEFLQHLGKGAFGDVIKVRNKLDGGYYAIKRIQLNPKNKALNKKIVREVMLLSRLNHENVVRYYNSWIETTTITGSCEDSSGVSTATTTNDTEEVKVIPKVMRKDEFTINDNIEQLAPPIKNFEVSVTYDSKSQAPYIDSSSDESSDEDEAWANVYPEESDSDGIEFERDSNESSKESSTQEETNKIASQTTEKSHEMVTQIDFMYIQMEFCEKSTLRTAIDDNLFLDESRVRRLFREIVEGLAHIHQQGMIHRDLKPVNIFLDSSDHVKIGDFGLATTIAIRSRQNNEYALSKSQIESVKEETAEESKTGQVGTALYVAPEINSASKAIYNQKVDIYSLGVILFEMCYRPLDTAMERIKILSNLRMREVIFPDDFLSKKTEKEQFLIRWLLNHDISKRPTSQELLQSEHVPPPVLEECELRELVRHTLSNPQLKGYKYLIASCFKQSVTAGQDITYDRDPSAPVSVKPWHLYEFVKETCIKIFKQHGGQNLTAPLLMPKSKYYEGVESCVKLMTHFGNIVSLPHDLRVPFARYVAWNNIAILRRFSIEKVFREKKVFGFIPRELYECAFDIVSPTPGNLMTDAETLYIAYEIINELPGVRNKHFLIRLNHTALIRAILLHCGIKDKQEEVFRLITDIRENKVPKTQMQQFLIAQGLSDNMINVLQNFLNSESEISKVSNQFQMITKRRSGEASTLAKMALQELKLITQNAEAYGVKFDMVVAPGLVYNMQQYSGMICQFVCELKRKHNHVNKQEVVAAGGRYDSMISYYRNIMEQASIVGKDIQQSAVGISLSLDRLVQTVQKEQTDEISREIENLDVVVCSIGSKQLIKEKTKILRNLWAAGIKCSLIEATNSEEIQEQLNDLKVMHAVILKESDHGFVRVRSRNRDSKDRNKYQEKQYPTSELVENMQKILKISNENKQKILKTSNENNQENIENVPSGLSRSESKSSNYSYDRNLQEAVVDISFVTVEKLSANVRKRYENQIRSQLDGLFKKLTGFVAVLGLTIESAVIRTVTAYLELESEQQFLRSVDAIIGKHQKHKQLLNDICDEIYEQKLKKTCPTVVLYSLPDNFYRLIA